MIPYGHKRKDGLTCEYGCCGLNKGNVANRKPSKRERVNKAARHRARQAAAQETDQSV